MRTTLDINPKLLDELIKLSGEKSRSKAVEKAVDDYVRRIKIAELQEMFGKIQIADRSEEDKEADLRREQFLDSLRDD